MVKERLNLFPTFKLTYTYLTLCIVVEDEVKDEPKEEGMHNMLPLVPRPSTPPVFDRLQYAKTEGEGLGNFIT